LSQQAQPPRDQPPPDQLPTNQPPPDQLQLALVAAMLAAMLVAEHYQASARQLTGDVAAG
jgi:hypothetical protein